MAVAVVVGAGRAAESITKLRKSTLSYANVSSADPLVTSLSLSIERSLSEAAVAQSRDLYTSNVVIIDHYVLL